MIYAKISFKNSILSFVYLFAYDLPSFVFENNLDKDQVLQNDLGPNWLTLWWFYWKKFVFLS